MRVLHFYRTAFPDTMGGIQQVISQIARGASKLGVKTNVLSLTSNQVPPVIEIDGYLLHRARLDLEIASTGFSVSAFFRFAHLAKQADVIHYHFPWPFMDLVHFATMHKKPTLVTYHSDIIRQHHLLKIYRPLKRKFLGDVNHIVATSPNYLASSEVLADYQDKVSIIPIGLDLKTYPEPTSEKLDYWRGRFGSKFFLFVGVLRYYKGLHILVESARELDYPIVIIGAGPVELELKKHVANFGLTNFFFLGQLPEDDKVALLKLSYAILFPSHLRSEAFGISLLEGAMYGKPMISSEIGTGTTFINIDKETGIVVPPSDAFALRQAMRYLWNNEDLAAKMGRQAQDRYWQYFTADNMVKAYVDIYESLINQQLR